MDDSRIKVASNGGIVLGQQVVCDGFFAGVNVRVQTHIHLDHMSDFDMSKGYHIIVMSEPTRELLMVEFNADLPYRSNLKAVSMGERFEIDGVHLELQSSGHMLGAVQVAVVLDDGSKVAYSGDFNWPLENVIEADILFVDSTYGSPDRTRTYTQEEVNSRFIELIIEHLSRGPVHVKAHRGTLERALELLDEATQVPMIAGKRLNSEIEVYRKFGYNIRPTLPLESDEGIEAISSGRYIRLYGTGDGDLFGITDGTAINLSAYMVSNTDPVLEFSPRSFRVAMTCHADFEGTLEYVRATGATHVITDNRRGGHAVELAGALRSHLGVDAAPSQSRRSRYWGE